MYNSQNAHPTLSNHQHSEGLLAHWHLLMAELRGPGTELCLTACPSIQQLWGLLPRPAPPTGKAQAGPPPAPPPRKGTSQPSSPQSPRKGTGRLSSTPTQGHMLAQHPPPRRGTDQTSSPQPRRGTGGPALRHPPPTRKGTGWPCGAHLAATCFIHVPSSKDHSELSLTASKNSKR